MKKYKLITYPNDILTTPANKIDKITKEDKILITEMTKIMTSEQGIGLAAPQAGVSKRILIYSQNLTGLEFDKELETFVISDNPESAEEEEIEKMNKVTSVNVMINPVITEKSDDTFCYEEGCLSIPGIKAKVERSRSISVTFLDINGRQTELTANNLEAICIQHEIDHLDGILFIDHLSRLRKKSLMKKYYKQFAKDDS